jgi:hypothetical protein
MPDRPPSAVDTVVLLYFLLVEESHLLLALVGEPLWVPPSVYDPSEQNLPHEALRRPELLSEIRQAIRHYEVEEQRHADPRGPAQRLRVADTLHAEGRLKVFELDARELLLLRSSRVVKALPPMGYERLSGRGKPPAWPWRGCAAGPSSPTTPTPSR